MVSYDVMRETGWKALEARRSVGCNSEAYCADFLKIGGLRLRLDPPYELNGLQLPNACRSLALDVDHLRPVE